MKRKILNNLFICLLIIGGLLSSSVVKAQGFISGIKPAFHWDMISGTQVKVGQRVMVLGYMMNDGSNTIPAGALNIDLSWSDSYATFDGWADPETGADISTPNGFTVAFTAGGELYVTSATPLLTNMSNWIQVAFYVKGAAVHPGITFRANLEPSDPPAFDQSLTASETFELVIKPAPLPITLTSFTVQNAGCNAAQLNWTTESALNFDHFEVERSTDNANFTRVSSIKYEQGKNSYGFNDPQLADGNYSYRLRNVDVDGTFKLSPVKSIIVKCTAGGITVVPTLATSQIGIKGGTGLVNVKIYSMLGQLVIEKQNVGSSDPIEISRLSKGTYAVQVWQNGIIVKTTTIVKM